MAASSAILITPIITHAANAPEKKTWSFNERRNELEIYSSTTDSELTTICAQNSHAKKADIQCGYKGIRSLAPVAELKQIEQLYVRYQVHGEKNRPKFDLIPLSDLTNLKKLYMDCAVKNTAALAKLTKLEFIVLGMEEENSIDFIKTMPALETLSLQACKLSIPDLTPLKDAKRLRTLTILAAFPTKVGSTEKELEPISSLTELTSLTITGNPNITSLNFLSGCTKLERLELSGCSNLKDISGLKNATDLKYLNLVWCDNVKDFAALNGCTKLTYIRISSAVPQSAVTTLKAAHPGADISH